MKEITISNISKLVKFNFLINKKSIITWSIAIFSFMFLYMILFPSIQDLATAKFEAMPEELLQFVGMTDMSDMSNYTTYFGMIFGIMIVAISIFSATFSAALITKEEKYGSIEFLNSLAVSRKEIYLSKYITSILSVMIVLLSSVISGVICGYIGGGETFVLIDILAGTKIASFSAIFFGGLGIMIAGLNSKFATGSMVSGTVLLSYLLGYLGQLLGENGEIFRYLSPFVQFNFNDSVVLTTSLLITLIIYYLIYFGTIIIGIISYDKRDFQI